MPIKVFTPEIVEEAPFPYETSELVGDFADRETKDVKSPSVQRENKVRAKRIAVELLSQSLNTRSRKIIQEFEFTESGALQIGSFVNGISGDLRLSPNGITARDIAGITTFAIDGTDGSAVFAGQLRAGSTIVSNSIITEQASSGNGRTVYLNDGVPAIIIGDPD